VQLPDMAQRIIGIGAHFHRQFLGIKRPAFAIAGEELNLADFGQTGFQRQRALQVMARNALVIGQRGQGPAGHFGRIAQVDVIGTGAFPVERSAL
jgi:hypothetical protein